ncbi:SIR2 family NAD-dependent protein deacylase [Streptosporangium sp. KLBMP 9127]|nr:SIR2 family protein [Streptosporangium sp. KLBMP 9127]
MDESDWHRLIDQLRNGDCTPLIGAGSTAGLLPTGGELAARWAITYDYPFADKNNLARVMQYAAAQHDTTFIKEGVSLSLQDESSPDAANALGIHETLANYPISVYLTTNYDNFMVKALEAAGKSVRQDVCRWYEDIVFPFESAAWRAGDDDSDPGADRPLVYHLHGHLSSPKSLVLTEDDYIEFLVRVTEDRAAGGTGLLPASVRRALIDKPLLFIGYNVSDWTFKFLLRGLLNAPLQLRRRRNVGVFVPAANSSPEARTSMERYFAHYLSDLRISIFWGTAAEFCDELRARTEGHR